MLIPLAYPLLNCHDQRSILVPSADRGRRHHESVLIPSYHALGSYQITTNSSLERPRTNHRFEFSASHLYLQASIFFSGKNMPGLAAHYRKDADSERQHGMQILEFVLKRGGGAMLLDAIPKRT
jgi:hypothetical protein